jgi:hypothetical protein
MFQVLAARSLRIVFTMVGNRPAAITPFPDPICQQWRQRSPITIIVLSKQSTEIVFYSKVTNVCAAHAARICSAVSGVSVR